MSKHQPAGIRAENIHIYWAWKSMKQRCNNPKCRAYKNYGKRGISVCGEWAEFEPFLEWALSSGYVNGFDIDRIDNNKGYSPDNCRWVSRKTNINNRRKTILLTVNDLCLPRTEWEEMLNLPKGIVKAWFVTHGKQYAEKRIMDVILNGYTRKNYSYSHTKSIQHESGRKFPSFKKAAEYYGIASSSISNSLRNDKPTRVGRFHVIEN